MLPKKSNSCRNNFQYACMYTLVAILQAPKTAWALLVKYNIESGLVTRLLNSYKVCNIRRPTLTDNALKQGLRTGSKSRGGGAHTYDYIL